MSDSKAVSSKGGRPQRTTPVTFLRQVVAELRKVVWPSQNQLRSYFVAVLFFVVVLMVIISVLDLGFGRLSFAIFGGAGS